MTIQEFITKWNGKYLERYDSSNKHECVDLILGYIDEVLGLGSIIPIGILNASDLWDKTHKLSPHVYKHSNTPQAVPQAGDIIVFSKSYNNGPGHTAIATGKGNTTSFEAFSQNDPLGKPCILKTYNYSFVTGWLRPKVLDIPTTPTMTDQQKIDYCNQIMKKYPTFYTSGDVFKFIDQRAQEIRELQNTITAKNKEITALKKAVEVAQNLGEQQLAQAKIDCEKKVADLTDKNRIDMEALETRYKEEIKKLKEEGNTVEVPVETPLRLRFKDKSANQKLLAIIEILGA